MALPGQGRDARRDDHAGEEERDPSQPPCRPRLAEPKGGQQGGQGREHQPPFHQPGEREQHRDRGDAGRRRSREPHAAQRHGGKQHGVARQDVLVHDGEEHHEARGEMEHRRQERDQAIAGQAADQQVDHGQAEAAAHRVQDGDLPPRIAGEHAQEVEQTAKRAVQRIVEVVRGIERRDGGVGDPGPQFQALEHAVAREAALGVVEPQNDRDQERAAAQHEQREIGEIAAWMGGRAGRTRGEDQGGELYRQPGRHAYRGIRGTTVARIRLRARCASVQPSGIAAVDLATEGVTDEKPSHRNHDRCRHGHGLLRQP